MTATSSQRFELVFAHDHPSFAGHFPGQPVVPGVLLLGDIVAAIARATGLSIERLSQARFSHAIRPSEVVGVSWRRDGAAVRFSASIDTPQGPKQVADGQLVLTEGGP